jgi:hypothetical protein
MRRIGRRWRHDGRYPHHGGDAQGDLAPVRHDFGHRTHGRFAAVAGGPRPARAARGRLHVRLLGHPNLARRWQISCQPGKTTATPMIALPRSDLGAPRPNARWLCLTRFRPQNSDLKSPARRLLSPFAAPVCHDALCRRLTIGARTGPSPPGTAQKAPFVLERDG